MYFKSIANTKEYQHELRHEQELNPKSPPKRIRRWGMWQCLKSQAK